MRLFLWILIGIGTAVLVTAISLKVYHGSYQRELDELERELAPGGTNGTFSLEEIETLPAPARRWLAHAIAEGTPLATSTVLELEGRMRLAPDDPWSPLTARHVIAAGRGYLWRATIEAEAAELDGAETWKDGVGEIRFWVRGFVPSHQQGEELDRGLADRLALDSVFTPAALLPRFGARFEPVDESRVRVTREVGGAPRTIELEVAANGEILSVATTRFGTRTDDRRPAAIPFGFDVGEERTFGGYTIPAHVRYAWWYGTDRAEPFLEITITASSYGEASAGRR